MIRALRDVWAVLAPPTLTFLRFLWLVFFLAAFLLCSVLAGYLLATPPAQKGPPAPPPGTHRVDPDLWEPYPAPAPGLACWSPRVRSEGTVCVATGSGLPTAR